MIDPTEADIGRKVIYRGYGGEIEEGVLTSFNSAYVFVRFGAGCTSQACSNDERIEWTFPAPSRVSLNPADSASGGSAAQTADDGPGMHSK